MSTVTWSSRYETGIAEIDIQHMRLFEIMNDLIESFRQGKTHSQISRVLDFLMAYCQEHLQTEETWMEDQGYPQLEEHKAEHRVIMENVREIKRRYESGHLMTMQLTVLMADWLEYHVEGSDMAYVEHARQRTA